MNRITRTLLFFALATGVIGMNAVTTAFAKDPRTNWLQELAQNSDTRLRITVEIDPELSPELIDTYGVYVAPTAIVQKWLIYSDSDWRKDKFRAALSRPFDNREDLQKAPFEHPTTRLVFEFDYADVAKAAQDWWIELRKEDSDEYEDTLQEYATNMTTKKGQVAHEFKLALVVRIAKEKEGGVATYFLSLPSFGENPQIIKTEDSKNGVRFKITRQLIP